MAGLVFDRKECLRRWGRGPLWWSTHWILCSICGQGSCPCQMLRRAWQKSRGDAERTPPPANVHGVRVPVRKQQRLTGQVRGRSSLH